jgi:excisionase family DNA binding protein
MKKMLTLRQAAERTNLSVPSIRMRIFRRTFPFTKLGARILVSEESLNRYLELSQQVTAEEAAERSEERCSL